MRAGMTRGVSLSSAWGEKPHVHHSDPHPGRQGTYYGPTRDSLVKMRVKAERGVSLTLGPILTTVHVNIHEEGVIPDVDGQLEVLHGRGIDLDEHLQVLLISKHQISLQIMIMIK